MALGATDASMGSGQRERRVGVIKSCRLPGVRGVARGAVMIVIAGHMVRIRCRIVNHSMTGVTIRRSSIVLAVRMALNTCRVRMGPSQMEGGQIMIEARRTPGRCRMTLCAIVSVVTGKMVWIARRVVPSYMTGIAIAHRVVVLTVDMTLSTPHSLMRPGQAEGSEVVVES